MAKPSDPLRQIRGEVMSMPADEARDWLLSLLSDLMPGPGALRWRDLMPDLPPAPCRFLAVMWERRGTRVPKSVISDLIVPNYGLSETPSRHTLGVHLCHLRRSIAAAALPIEIETLWGYGYRLTVRDGWAPPWEQLAQAGNETAGLSCRAGGGPRAVAAPPGLAHPSLSAPGRH